MMWSIPTVREHNEECKLAPKSLTKRSFHVREACVCYGKQKRGVKEAADRYATET